MRMRMIIRGGKERRHTHGDSNFLPSGGRTMSV
jgi:hypothetical protein